MSIKSKILLILIITAVASAVVTGAVLIALVQMLGEVSLVDNRGPILTAIAIALYLVGGLVIIGLLYLLLQKHVIVPSVEKNRLETERTMLTEQLHHAQKMEAVGQLAGSIAHDFNNLLTIVDGYASLIAADPQGQQTASYVDEIIEAARKATTITRKLLGFSHNETRELVLLDLNTTLKDTDKMLSRLIGDKITLVTKPHDDPIHVQADPIQLGQVLMNLAVNARDAMPNGGRITIKIDRKDVVTGAPGVSPSLSTGSYAEISVSDTGLGMDEETMPHIFEPFYTTKDCPKGGGLGLSIVKSIMKKSNGVIEVKSTVGSGTTFYIYLPCSEVQQDVAEPIEKPAVVEVQSESLPEIEQSAATILLVEDDPMIRNLILHTLEQKNYTVVPAEDGWEGIKIAKNHKGKIDLLFTDVVMPGLGGVELAVAMRELYPEIKTLFMSGYSRSQLEEEGIPAGAAALEKPFTPDKVLAMVAEILAEKSSA